MTGFEYKVVPAPRHGLKAKGVKGTQARFANALETVMNDLGLEGWEYQRTDTLPVEERQGLTGKLTTFQNMLVFRRALEVAAVDVPEVAALIEDQTEVLAVVADVPEVEDVAAAEDILAEVEQTPAPARDAALPLEGVDRVDETLKAPFVFPWNKRGAAASPSKDNDSHIPAE